MPAPLYLLDVYPSAVFHCVPVKRRGLLQLAPGQSADGYGSKIQSDYMVTVLGRKYRVYIRQYSNVGSAYVRMATGDYYVRDRDIPDTVRQTK
jgi:hypothetical protein